MLPNHILPLEFDHKLNDLGKEKKLTDGLSAVVRIGDYLWLAHDETVRLERLSLHEIGKTGIYHAKDHKAFELKDFFELSAAEEEEADLEGLAYDDDYLWLVGSHSLKRKNPNPAENDGDKIVHKLAKLEGEGNRYLLARIPVSENGKTLEKQIGDRHAARLHGDALGDELMEALRHDEHLSPFLPIPPKDKDDKKDKWRGIPGKDNGFDIEGLAVAGGRLFLGLRGPVLRGWALILEIELTEDVGNASPVLRLKSIGKDGRRYRKHFLQLGGLGIRDLCVCGSDILVLAGPTMNLDGPVRLFRWASDARSTEEEDTVIKSDDLAILMDIPYGKGEDHAEGICTFTQNKDAIAVVYDSASKRRLTGTSTILADIFQIPAT